MFVKFLKQQGGVSGPSPQQPRLDQLTTQSPLAHSSSAREHAQRRRLYPVCGGDGGGALAAERAASFFAGARSVWVTPSIGPRLTALFDAWRRLEGGV